MMSEEKEDGLERKCPQGCNGGTHNEQMKNVATATADIAGNAVHELSPVGAIDNIYSGIRDGAYGQVALGVAEIDPWGKLATKAIKGLAKVPKSNPVPDKLVRVFPGDVRTTTLGAPGADDVFVTTADDIA